MASSRHPGFKRHGPVVIEKLAANPEEIRLGFHTPDLVQKRRRHAFPKIIHELLHALALHLLRRLKTGLRFPQRLDVIKHLAALRMRHRSTA